jgi:hypothetical protein
VRRLKRWLRHPASPWLLALLTYTLGSLLFTLPMPLQINSAIWGDRFDAWTTMWLIWHLHDAVSTGTLEAVTDRIFYPQGYNLWSFGHMAIQAVGVPLMALGFSLTATYNLLLLGAFTATGMTAHALGHRLSGNHWGGLLAGSIFAFNPYTYGEMSAGCVELVAAWFIPAYALALVRVADKPTWQRGAVAAAVLACTGPFNWYYTAFLGMFTGAFLLWRLLAGGATRNRTVLVVVLAAMVAGISNVPLIQKARRETPSRSLIEATTFSTENWNFVNEISNGSVPLPELTEAHLELNDAMQVAINSTSLSDLVQADFPPNPLESTPGRLAYALGLFGLILAGRRGRPWALMAAGFTVLTLGPYLQIDSTPPIPDWSLASPLPYKGLYNELPFFSKAYRPYRIGVLVLLCLSALAATGFGRLRHRWAMAVPIGAFLVGISQPHWTGVSDRELGDATIPSVYEDLALLPEGAVIELPLQYQPVTPANARYQYNQVVHRQDLLNCNQLIRRTDLARFQDYVAANTFLQVALDLGRQSPPYRYLGADLQSLHEQGFRYLIAHTSVELDPLHLAGFHGDSDRLRQPAWDMLSESFGEPVLVGADGTLVYAMPAQVPSGEQRWEASRWVDLELPQASLGLPVPLGEAGLELPIDQPVQRIALWIAVDEDPTGEVVLHAGGRAYPVKLQPGSWTMVQQDFPRPVSEASLSTPEGRVDVRLSSIQAELAP